MRKFSISIFVLLIYLLLITYTLAARFFGVDYQPIFTPLITLLAFIFAVLHGGMCLGWKRAFLLLGLTVAVSLFFESIGVATGWVYGPYHYTDMLGVKFLGLVPFLIPVAWYMMSYSSFVIAARLVPSQRSVWTWRFLVAGLGAVAMTAWDLAMDPLMVAGGHWVWEVGGDYFGVPIQNFWGWWLTIFVAFILFLAISRVKPGNLFLTEPEYTRLAVLSYGAIGLSSIVANFQIGLAGPGLAGLFAMLPWFLLGWLRFTEDKLPQSQT